MKYLLIYALSTVLTCISFTSLIASDPVESDYYQIDQIPIPEGVVLETSGIEMLPNGKLAVCGRRSPACGIPTTTTAPTSSRQSMTAGASPVTTTSTPLAPGQIPMATCGLCFASPARSPARSTTAAGACA